MHNCTIFRRINVEIPVVKSYIYLGIPIPGSALCYNADLSAVDKSQVATGTFLSILAKSKTDLWVSRNKLFGSLVESTLFYGIE